ncbi:hypothetical protein Sango_0040200 [Sesamum angolense]|uniref:SWIM-type domain-containing protein n=1 Tax=Sesamum angolense TaxID=2727404 RepID=A0AAE1XD02_9LAMI|nr:hypothetical protein Sango_0040200 [Sesamum angolense]
MPIKNDRDLQYFFNPMTGYVSIDIFVQAEKIREMVVLDDPAVSEWGTYMSMLTQELSSVLVVTQSMGRFGINDDYPGPSSYASPSDYAGPSSFAGPSDYAGPSSFAGPSDYAGTSSPAGPSVSSEQDDEPEADSMLNNEHVDSEPDEGSHTYVVKLKHKTCSCGKWGTHGIPCSHAIQVSRYFGVNASNFIPQYYSIRAYRKTYQGRFEPLYGEEYWDPVDIELVHNKAVRVRRGPGRYVSMRIPNEMDRPQARARQQYQSRQV